MRTYTEKMNKEVINHLQPIENTDTYFLCVGKYTSCAILKKAYTNIEKWVKLNGGEMTKAYPACYVIGDNRGYSVKIDFPNNNEEINSLFS